MIAFYLVSATADGDGVDEIEAETGVETCASSCRRIREIIVLTI